MSYSCQHCDYRSVKWMGFCPQCRTNQPLTEAPPPGLAHPSQPVPLTEITDTEEARRSTGLAEFDRLLGGGLVEGSAILLGGEPGIGKSTLLLQVAASLTDQDGIVLMASAEESSSQIALRARRLQIKNENLWLLAEPDVDRIIAAARSIRPHLLVVDSIQTVTGDGVEGSAGGPAQMREAVARLLRYAKSERVAVVLIGHVTKDGSLAGPKLVEHMVDVVLSFEGDPDQGLRALRSQKNRFGAGHLVAMFDMTGEGLREVTDPSRLFMGGWQQEVPGTVAFPAVDGRRAILVEVQALAVPSTLSQPRRSVRGVDPLRVNQLLAVLHRRASLPAGGLDIYLNLVGGWRIDEPAADLAIALSLVSAIADRPLGSVAAWGEVGLTGEVRAVPFHQRRFEEARRLGVENLVAAPSDGDLWPGVSDLAAALLRAGIP
ncbi:MAG TPA: DNA repair protein RadA [Acidimicrobiia bacterium]|nr:DNA repair protein RadA [Acidimicrobiia bacterium]